MIPSQALSVYDLFGTLAAGASVRVASDDALRAPERLLEILTTEPITFWDSAPAALAQLAPYFEAFGEEAAESALRLVFLSGDWIPLTLPDAVRETFPRARVVALGGATEAAIWSNFHPVEEIAETWRSIPYGRPIPNARYYVLDADLRPSPVGVPGDLYIGGDCVLLAYQGDAALTAAKILPDPLAETPGARMYRTGDRARFWADGTIEFLGRLDHQVKVRGYRIELGEIEARARRLDDVREAVVLVREDRPGDRRLVAYLVPDASEGSRSTERPDVAALRDALGEHLPEYMIPAAFVWIDRLPVTANGKLDRRALPAPEVDRAELGSEFAAPRDEIETKLAEAWGAVLGAERVGIHDNFFHLGGDSILGMQVVNRIRAAGLRVTPQELFHHPTVAELASVVQSAKPADEASAAVPEGPLPLSPVQRFFFELDLDHPHHWNQALLFSVERPLDADRLRRALRALVAHHDALRLRFVPDDAETGTLTQRYSENDSVGFEHRVVEEAFADHEAASASLRETFERAQASLDLANGPLVHAVFVEARGAARDTLGAGRLLLVIHHLVVDGVSWRILIEDLQVAYGQLEVGAEPLLPAKTAAFGRFAEWLVERVEAPSDDLAEAFDEEIETWRRVVDAPAPRLPADAPEAPDTYGRVETVIETLDASRTRALLREAPTAYRARAEDLLLVALARAFAPWTGERRLRVDLEAHGRDLPASLAREAPQETGSEPPTIDRTVGWFTSLHPHTLDLGASHAIGEQIRAIKEALRQRPRGGASYGLLRYLHPEGERLAAPPAEVSFNYLGQVDAGLEAGVGEGAEGAFLVPVAEPTGPLHASGDRRPWSVDVLALARDGRLHLQLVYAGERFARATMERLVAGLRAEVAAVVDHCLEPAAGGYTPSDFPLARLDAATLDAFVGDRRDLEDVFPLSPMQEAMAFQTRLEGGSMYVCQLSFRLADAGGDEARDASARIERLRRAWAVVLDRHPILRASFGWWGVPRLLQRVHERVDMPFEALDWSDLAVDEQARRLDDFLRRERERGFDLETPPLQRFAAIDRGAEGLHCAWTFHHLVLDGWSMRAVLGELFAVEAALAAGRAPSLPPAPSFRRYVEWLDARDDDATEQFWRGELAGLERPTPLGIDLPSETSESGSESAEIDDPHATRRYFLDADLSARLGERARGLGVTLNTLFQGAWAVLLSRFSGEREVLFGSTVSGRPTDLDGAEEIVGMFINTLPVRADVDPQAELRPWLEALQRRQIAQREHQHTPVVAIQRWSGLPAGVPMYESLVLVENFPDLAGEGGEGPGAIEDVHYEIAHDFPLQITVTPGEPLSLRLTWLASRLESASVDRLVGRLEALLAEMVANPDVRLGALRGEDEASRRLLPDPTQPLEAPAYPRAVDRPFAFAAPSRENADAPAVRGADGRSWSYGELVHAAGRVARAVADAGLVGRRVAITGERSFGLVAAIVGTMRAGGVAVPIDPALPAPRRRLIAETASIEGIFSSGSSSGSKAEIDAAKRFVFAPETGNLEGEALEGGIPENKGRETGDLPPLPGPDDPAYVFFTSGTTGVPKGVLGRHRGLDHFVAWEIETLGLQAGTRCAQLTGLSFDVVLRDLFLPLGSGGVLCLPASRDLAADRVLPWLDAEAVEVVHSVPSILATWLRADAPGVSLRALRHLLSAGEPLERSLVERFRRRFPESSAQTWNLYGPTETTLAKACFPVPDPPRPGVQPLGRPLPHAQLLVVVEGPDGAPRRAGFGEPGEIVVRTPFRSLGYLDTEDLAEETSRFALNPFRDPRDAEADDDQVYLTGDRGRYLADGSLAYGGRFDDQVKVRGVRVEPGEVAAHLRRHAGVREAVVLGRDLGADGEKEIHLVAYFVADGTSGEPATSDTLRRHLRQRLPDALVPTHFVALDALPLTANGKVDRQALPDPRELVPEPLVSPAASLPASLPASWKKEIAESVRSDLAAGRDPETIAARVVALIQESLLPGSPDEPTSTELAVAAAFADLLPSAASSKRPEAIGPTSDFFDLGGHSLLAMQLVARLQRDHGVELPLDVLFEASTVRALARKVDAAQPDAGASRVDSPEAGDSPEGAPSAPGALAGLPPIEPEPSRRYEPFPLSDLQEAYWIGQRQGFELGARAHSYRELHLPDLDLERFEAAWRRLIERHDMLRAVVAEEGEHAGELRVLETPPRPFTIEHEDLSALSPEEAEARVVRVRERMVRQGPRTDTWPLFDLFAHRLPDGSTRFHVSLSLILSDGWSTLLLIGELARLYREPDATLPPIELTPRDYATALRKARESAAYEKARAYWWDRLDALPGAPELPLAKDPQAATNPAFARRSGRLDAARWERLRGRFRAAGLTPTAGLATAYAAVLAAWSKGPRFLLNLLFFNRLPLHPEVGRLVGNFSTTLLLEVEPTRGLSFAAASKQLQRRLWRDMEHGLVTGVEVLRELNRRRGGGGRAAAPVIFTSTLDLAAGESDRESRDDLPLAHGALQTPQVWLDHQAWESREGLHWNWDAVDEIFPPGLVDALFAAYGRLVERLAEDDSAWNDPPSAAEEGAWNAAGSLLPVEQLDRRMTGRATARPLSGELLHSRFARHAAEHPERPAILAEDRELSYGELDRLARRIGRELRRRGAAVDTLVAVVAAKSWQQAVAALGVLYSGAAYLPIDAGLPTDRRARLLERGGARFALTRAELVERLEWPDTVEVLAVDGVLEDGKLPADDEPLEIVQRPEDIAYVIFTSGSTGEPKGVTIDHRGAVNTIDDIERRFAIGPEDRSFGLSSLSFDLSVWDLFGPWSTGGALVLPAADDARDPAAWLASCRRHGVTVWNSVPALAEMLVAHSEGTRAEGTHGEGTQDDEGAREAAWPDSLRLVLMSGDWIPVSLPGRLRALAPDLDVVSLGGATEASIWSIVHEIREVDPAWPSIPYGRPLANQTFHVLDDELEPRPDWVPGELYIGGVGLAEGYWRDGARTAAAFVPYPRAKTAGARLYRTGDWGRFRPNGEIEFLGREDLQVKVQGYRIELGEIEAHLGRLEGVESAVVTAPEATGGGRRLVAYVVPEKGVPEGNFDIEDFDTDTIRSRLAETLPDYMLPSIFVPLDALPLSNNGKVDRKALPAPEEARRDDARRRPPRDERERRLVALWEELLGVEDVSIDDDFFALGGHSLAAVRLASRIEAEFGRRLPLGTILEGASVAALAERLAAGGNGDGNGDEAARALVPIGAAARRSRASESDRPRLFLVHPVGGNVLCYAELARALGDDVALFGLQSLPLDEPASVPNIETMARTYLEEVRALQPDGPYRLGGWSMGGVVAFEMARQLRAVGEEVALVAMIDVAAPGTYRPDDLDDAWLLARFARDLGGLVGEEAPGGLGSGDQSRESVEKWARSIGALPADLDDRAFDRLFDLFAANFRALARYRPASLDTAILLLPAEGSGDEFRDAASGWRPLAADVRVHPLPGDHYSLVRPPLVDTLARRLRDLSNPSESP